MSFGDDLLQVHFQTDVRLVENCGGKRVCIELFQKYSR
jgi:hypothetical protein